MGVIGTFHHKKGTFFDSWVRSCNRCDEVHRMTKNDFTCDGCKEHHPGDYGHEWGNEVYYALSILPHDSSAMSMKAMFSRAAKNGISDKKFVRMEAYYERHK